MDNNIIIKKLDILIKKAEEHTEIPVAAVIVYNNKIIASSYNKTELKKNILSHAEINAIQIASKKLNTLQEGAKEDEMVNSSRNGCWNKKEKK